MIADGTDDVAVDLHMVCIIDPIDEFLDDFGHNYFLRLSVCLRTLVGWKVRTMLVGIAYIIITSNFSSCDSYRLVVYLK